LTACLPCLSLPGKGIREVYPLSETLLRDIAKFCRRARMAEFTFGRLAVNDGKLVSRLRLASFTQASDFLHRASVEAEVDRVLIIGGDDNPVGPFHASLDLLATGVVERHGITRVAFAGYPEGHPAIDSRTLDAASPDPQVSRHSRSSLSAAASALRSVRWPVGIRRSRASWRRLVPTH
jgi:hypothetical protein